MIPSELPVPTSLLIDELTAENERLRRENHQLRQMIPLLKQRIDAFLIWFQNTVNGIHP